MDVALNNLQRLTCHKTQTTNFYNPPSLCLLAFSFFTVFTASTQGLFLLFISYYIGIQFGNLTINF